jgi:hypothetical protein
MKPVGETLGVTKKLLVAVEFPCPICTSVVDQPAHIRANLWDGLTTETTLVVGRHQDRRTSLDAEILSESPVGRFEYRMIPFAELGADQSELGRRTDRPRLSPR